MVCRVAIALPLTLVTGKLSSTTNVNYQRSKPTNGFTLIELLVVMALIGIVMGMIILSINPNTQKDRQSREVRRLYALMVLAAEESVLQSRQYGIRFSETSYSFYELKDNAWVPADEPRFADREIIEDYEVMVEIDSLRIVLDKDNNVEEPKPQIMMLSSGEIIPDFNIVWRDPEVDDSEMQIKAGEFAALELKLEPEL